MRPYPYRDLSFAFVEFLWGEQTRHFGPCAVVDGLPDFNLAAMGCADIAFPPHPKSGGTP